MTGASEQISTIQNFVNSKNYADGYNYVADQIRDDPRWNSNLSGWFEAAAEINGGGSGSFLRQYVFTSNAIAAGLDPESSVTLAKNQAVSDALAAKVLQQYMTALQNGEVLTPTQIYDADVSIAVENFGIDPWLWAGGPPGQLFYDLPVGKAFEGDTYRKILAWDTNALKTFASLADDFPEEAARGVNDVVNSIIKQLKDRADEVRKTVGNWLTDMWGDFFEQRDPLALDIDGNGVQLTALRTTGVHFDLEGDGAAERTGWVSAGDALLVRDVNGNGMIDNGNELFGNATTNGFAALAAFDTNHDGIINASDPVFSQLRAWRDTNQDGISQAGELLTMAQTGIASINLTPTASTEIRAGNSILFTGNFTLTSGGQREIIAAAFNTDQVNSVIGLPAGTNYNPAVHTLPNLRGYGLVPDLWVAMTLDPDLLQMVQAFVASGPASLDAMRGQVISNTGGQFGARYFASAFENILSRWAGVSTDADNDDAYQMQLVVERFLNRELPAAVRLTPTSGTTGAFGTIITTFQDFSTSLAVRFLTSMSDIQEDRPLYDMFQSLAAASAAGGGSISQPVLEQILADAEAAAANPPALTALQQSYRALDYDFSTDAIVGDKAGFLASDMATSWAVNTSDYWAGYGAWSTPRVRLLRALDPIHSEPNLPLVEEARRIQTGNQSFWNMTGSIPTQVTGNAGDNTLTDSALNTLTFFRGLGGNDTLQGNGSNDVYVFGNGFGNDLVIDAANSIGPDTNGSSDEIAFQGVYTSALANFAFADAARVDLLISFTGYPDTVRVQNYFLNDGTATIERVSFADGRTISSRQILDAAMAQWNTPGNDSLNARDTGSLVAGGSGNDTLSGKWGDDALYGGPGNDVLQGDSTLLQNTANLQGNDLLDGGEGNDVLYGGIGINTYRGGAGDDIFYVNNRSDTITEFAGEGIDEVRTALPVLSLAANVELLTFTGGSVAFIGIGNGGNNLIVGGTGADQLYGMAGHDTLDGGGGSAANTLLGGTGDDIYLVNVSGTSTVEYLDEGIDEVRTTFGIYALQANVENLTYLDNLAHQAGVGNALDNIIRGGTGGDDLFGREGNDTLYGGSGTANTLFGQAGNDIYVVNAVGDSVIEFAGEGNDTVRTELATFVLRDNVENLTYIGAASFIGVGAADGNVITGGIADDQLNGMAGDDILIGRSGADLLQGGAGADQFRYNGGETGLDRVLDFVSGQDKIVLSSTGFVRTATVDFVQSGAPAASSVNSTFLYNVNNGIVSYDADGTGAGAAVQIAQLNAGLTLAGGDFIFG